jgi:hypothetical protein
MSDSDSSLRTPLKAVRATGEGAVSRPILFSAPMVRAILAGTKTQTRRVVKGERASRGMESGWFLKPYGFLDNGQFAKAACPYGQPGDRLWVRESGRLYLPARDGTEPVMRYAADGNTGLLPETTGHWTSKPCPSIHMPRWACRIELEITGVRVERLQKISEADAQAEGIEWNPNLDPLGPCKWRHYGQPNTGIYPASSSFETLWKSINGAGSWDANPWVWVVEFKRVTA